PVLALPNCAAIAFIYSLSLHDALPICRVHRLLGGDPRDPRPPARVLVGARPADRDHAAGPLGRDALPRPDHLRARLPGRTTPGQDRKSTRLNSSHVSISYAVFCLKKKI